jgi:hypothetical protein
MSFLGLIRPHAECVAVGSRRRPADRQAADLLRRGDVPVEKSRRKIAVRGAVEAMIGLIRRQERRGVNFDCQQVADDVLVFGAVQASQGRGSTGIGARCGGAVERRFETGHENLIRLLIRPRSADRRHLPRSQLPHDFFPNLGVGVHVFGANGVEI